MEESEKRRERLKAMRTEATQGGVHSNDEDSAGASYSLTNPLIEVTPSVHLEPNVAPRFDYYTDPMSAFSANKGRSKVSHQISPDYFTPPRPRNADMTPTYQAQTTYGPDQRMFQTPGSYRSSGPFRSPMRPPSTFGTPPQGNMNVACGTYGFPSNFSRGGSLARPDFAQRGSPRANYVESREFGMNNNPQTGSGNWGGRSFPHSERGRARWLGGNSPQTGSGNWGRPYHHSGRGTTHWHGNNPGSTQSGRRIGPHENVSAELRPDLYYHKSMVEDPWETLEPVIWRRVGLTSLDTPNSSKSWLPKSISTKRARVSETSTKYTAGKSLAEDLAASFHAAGSYEPHGDSAEDNS